MIHNKSTSILNSMHFSDDSDPLSGAAGGWEPPKFPLLMPDRICEFKISKATKQPTKEDANRESLTLVLKTEKDYTGADGKPLRAGFSVYKRIGLSPTDGKDDKRPRTWKNIGEDLAMLLKAAGMVETTPRQLIDDPTIVEQAIVMCKVGISKGTGTFPDSNTLTFVLPA